MFNATVRTRHLAPLIAAFALIAIQHSGLGSQVAPSPLRIHERIDGQWRFERADAAGVGTPSGALVTGWKWIADPNWQSDAATMTSPALDISSGGWQNMPAGGGDVFNRKPGFAWFRTVIAGPRKAPVSIHFESVDDNATVYLNGKMLKYHTGWNDPFDVDVKSEWRTDGPNTLVVLVENNAGGGGIAGDVVLTDATINIPHEAATDYNASSWQIVHLPHDYVVSGTFDKNGTARHGFLPSGAGWYRKTLTIPATASGKRLSLQFDGVYRNSSVWVNGTLVGQHACGYTGYRCDITNVAHVGDNKIAVFVDARKPEGWWYEGGGIYRHVWLNITNPVAVAADGVNVNATVTGLHPGEKPSASLKISTTLENKSAKATSATLLSWATRPDGTVAGSTRSVVTVPAGGQVDVGQSLPEPKPQLWSLETPRLYTLSSVVSVNGQAVDAVTTPFGVRSIRYDADTGFYLNEKHVEIQGTCNHQDFAGVGTAMPDGILSWRIKKLKEMGSNAYRTSHNEVASELLDACDTQGMLVMDETRHFGDGEAGKASQDTPAVELSNLREQVMRDRNHPSIIMWSIGNEEASQGSAGGLRIGIAMKAVCNELDPSRPVSEAVVTDHGKGSSTILDMEGFNYWPGGYDRYHDGHPGHPMFGSEIASALNTRGVYAMNPFPFGNVTEYGVPENGWMAAYDINRPGWGQTTEEAWQPIASHPFVAGGFVWTGFDYRGEPDPFLWPCISSQFGILDTCGFPKDSFYYYQEVWGSKPIVHIFPHWNWAGKEGQPINVWAYSNADQVELFLNGASLGAKAVPKAGHVEWQVPYAPGKLTAKATTNGNVVAIDNVFTTGAPVAIRLTTDRPTLISDGEDESPVAVAIVDANGRVVPTADNLVTFTTAGFGEVAGVGNGNPSSHEPDVATKRMAFNGLCMAVVKAGDSPGTVKLTATAAGLRSATITLRVGP